MARDMARDDEQQAWPADHAEALAGIVAYLVVTGRITEAAAFVRLSPRLRRAVLWLARWLLDDSLDEQPVNP